MSPSGQVLKFQVRMSPSIGTFSKLAETFIDFKFRDIPLFPSKKILPLRCDNYNDFLQYISI